MKVALLHFCFYEYTVELANALATKNIELTLIHPENLTRQTQGLLDSRIKIITFKKYRIRDPRNLSAMRKLISIIRKIQPDVLHVQETNDPWYDLTLLLNKMPPLVTTIHDVFRHPGDKDNVIGSEYTRQIAFWRSQQLIVHANFLKNALVKEFAVPQERVCILPHGELGSLYQRLSKNNNTVREPYTLLFYGRIWAYKGLNYLLQAMPLIIESIPQVKLIIAGKGENFKRYFPDGWDEKHYEILNKYIPSEDVASLFGRSTAVILPYIEASQSGVASLAYGMGTPVIASEIGGLGEMIDSEQDGLLVPPRDAKALADTIIRLLSDGKLQHQIQTAALYRCEDDLNWLNIATQTIEIYRKAIYLKNSSR
ncbi:MAG: glycosyltransferase family 4 protein [Cyanobacteria bacterium J06633_8]